ncbi:M48 family metallopeptidase [Pseudomonas aeruginosa]
MKGTVHPRRLLLCLVLVPALLAGLGAWQSWRAEQQAERLGAAQQRVERALAEARALPPRASVRVDGRAYVRDLALARLDEQLADTRSAQRLNRFAAILADSGACLAALVAVLGAVSLAGIAGAARSALRSRRCLLLWFELGRRLLPCLLLAQIGLLALALACAGTFEILGLWRVGQVPVSEGRTQLSVALILLGLLASAWQMLAKISRLRLRPAPALDVIGRRLGEEDAPELWTLLRELAARLDTPAPQHLLVGLCDGFYVTANRVCLQPSGEHLEGRSLYLSLPLLGLLDRAELSAVIAHELAHFAGRDAHYSLRFLPIYQGAASQLAAIEEQEANVFERAALEPARLLAGYFLERFGLAVNHWSRLREFAADRRAAQLAGAPAMASALLRSAAAGAPIRAFLEHCLLAPARAPDNLVDAIHVYLGRSGREAPPPPGGGVLPGRTGPGRRGWRPPGCPARAPDNLVDAIHVYLGQSGLEAPAPGAEGLQVHPQDTHPPLGLRCTALGESFERTWAGTAGRAVPTRPPSQALGVWFGAPLALSRALSADLLGKTCENPHARN